MGLNRNIILLTKVFPFATGEEFLEEEIHILASSFSNIFIIATAVPEGAKLTRVLPQNAKCYVINETVKKYLKYTKYVAKGSRYIFDADVRSELKSKAIKGKLAVIYLAGRSHVLANKILHIPEIAKILEVADTILYSYWFADLPYVSVLLKRIINNNSLKIISRAHGYDLYEYRNASGFIPFRKIVMQNINKVFPCSCDGQYYLRDKFPDSVEKIEVSYLGTQDCGMAENMENKIFHIVTCSAIISLKRLDLLAKALKLCEEDGFQFKWTCIGDGPLLDQLKEYVNKNLKQDAVVFRGRLKHSDVMDYLKTNPVSLFVNVSETEGLPVSIMEAVSFGIPALATDVGGTKEIVIQGITGFLLAKDVSVRELADKIIESTDMILDRKNVRAYWQEHFNSDKNYKRFCEKLISI